MKNRPEIDGLRAIAVVPVVLFHAQVPHLAGGFVGVDIFFVISGYLITSILLEDLEKGRFSIARFYERRARRILPALFLICGICIPFAWMWMLPHEMKDFSQSLASVAIFSSNILFFFEMDYFSPSAELKPLLHTWSLSVEEQFYVVFPAVILALSKLPTLVRVSVIFAATIISLFLAQWMSERYQAANFYLLPSRAWELGAGALIAIWCPQRPPLSKVAELASASGLLLIVLSISLLNEQTPFPGFYALAPVIGTGLIIVFAADTTVGKLLSSTPFVTIGLANYSAYLIHQPLLAFTRIRYVEPVPLWLSCACVAVTFVFSFAVYTYVERPFRSRTAMPTSTIVRGAVLGSILLFCLGVAGHLYQGFPDRRPDGRQMAARLSANLGLGGGCDGASDFFLTCANASKPEIIVWGDSFAMHLVDGIVASDPRAKIVQATKSTCGPFFDVAPVATPRLPPQWSQTCVDFNDNVKRYIARTKSLKYAVLSSPFTAYVSDKFHTYAGGQIYPSGVEPALVNFQRTLDWLRSQNVMPVVVSPPPYDGTDIGICLARSAWLKSDDKNCAPLYIDVFRQDPDTHKFLTKISEDYSVIFLSDYLCHRDHDRCDVRVDGTPIYRDMFHLSKEGSAALGRQIGLYGLITRLRVAAL